MSPDRVLVRLDELLDTMSDPKAAYVVRSRLDRFLLVLGDYVANMSPRNPETAAALTNLGQHVNDGFEALRRRSEPFGSAWVLKLAMARDDVLLLRAEVIRAPDRELPAVSDRTST